MGILKFVEKLKILDNLCNLCVSGNVLWENIEVDHLSLNAKAMMHLKRLRLLIPFLVLLLMLLVSYINGHRVNSKERLEVTVSEIK